MFIQSVYVDLGGGGEPKAYDSEESLHRLEYSATYDFNKIIQTSNFGVFLNHTHIQISVCRVINSIGVSFSALECLGSKTVPICQLQLRQSLIYELGRSTTEMYVYDCRGLED